MRKFRKYLRANGLPPRPTNFVWRNSGDWKRKNDNGPSKYVWKKNVPDRHVGKRNSSAGKKRNG